MESILVSIKKMLGIDESYTCFDVDILMHINSAFTVLTQLGVGPAEGYAIKDANDTWDAFLPVKPLQEFVKSYVFLKVKLIFDPPTSSAVLESYKNSVSELEWRIQVLNDPIETRSEEGRG